MSQTIDQSRAQLIADLQERAEAVEQLNRIAAALTSEFDLQRLLQMITDAARKVTAAEYAAFFLIPEVAGKMAMNPTIKSSPTWRLSLARHRPLKGTSVTLAR